MARGPRRHFAGRASAPDRLQRLPYRQQPSRIPACRPSDPAKCSDTDYRNDRQSCTGPGSIGEHLVVSGTPGALALPRHPGCCSCSRYPAPHPGLPHRPGCPQQMRTWPLSSAVSPAPASSSWPPRSAANRGGASVDPESQVSKRPPPKRNAHMLTGRGASDQSTCDVAVETPVRRKCDNYDIQDSFSRL